jgi:serine/threonine-protein kinase
MRATLEALDVPSAIWARWETRIHDFEIAWAQGERPALSTCLPHQGRLRRAVLIELVQTELELRLKNGERARIEEYLTRYPELAAETGTVLDLVAAENRLRRLHDSAAGLAEYRRRFPDLSDALVRDWTRLAKTSQPTVQEIAEPAVAKPPVIPGIQILAELGRGGMGIVYKAFDRTSGRLVALKTLAPGLEQDQQVIVRFQLEARVLARLRHPSFVQLLGTGIHAGLPFLTFEYISGGNLADRLAGGRPPVRQSARLIARLARALHAAHRRGIVHCDLKPANILLVVLGKATPQPKRATWDPRTTLSDWLPVCVPKIGDFGLAHFQKREVFNAEAGDIFGTPAYMAPEQAAGNFDAIGPATDVYGLGAIFYEMLTGTPPFRASRIAETLAEIRTQPPCPPGILNPQVSPSLETICLRCLNKAPSDRYTTALDLANEITRCLQSESRQARARPRPDSARWVCRTGATQSRDTAPAARCENVLAAVHRRA